MSPYDTYATYLAMKKHFTDAKYDYFKYNGKTRSSVSAFNKRKDKYFFERMSRKLSDDEIRQYFIANFVASDNPSAVWVGEIIQFGERNYKEWVKKNQSLTYIFTQECEELFSQYKLEEVFSCKRGHPPVLKAYLAGELSIETMVIFNKIFSYLKKVDKVLIKDPAWDTVRQKILKYSPFLQVDIFKCKKILRGVLNV